MIQFSYTFDPETRTLTPSGDPVNVKGDTNVVQIIFAMPASYEGLALSSYVWRVFYKIARNTKLEEVRFHQFTNPTTEGENLVLTWTVTNSVTEFAGHLGFALSGTLTDTGGNVTNRINSIPAYERIEPTIGGGSYTEDDAEIEGIKDFLVGIQEAAEAAQAAAETAAAEAEASAARAEQIADELEPYKALAIVESASGDPATFTDGSNGVTMKSVSVWIEPVQDLHGYEYPWVGGAGKNLLPPFANETVGGVTATVDNNGVVTLNGSCTASASLRQTLLLKAGSYRISGAYGNSDFYTGSTMAQSNRFYVTVSGRNYFDNTTGGMQFTLDADTDVTVGIAFVVTSTTGITFNNSKVYPMIRLSSVTDSTFAPYSNICPISGWDEVKVTRTGKNLLDLDAYVVNTNFNRSTGAKTATGVAVTATSADGYTVPTGGRTREASIKLPPNTDKITISANITSTSTTTASGYIYEYDEDGVLIGKSHGLGALSTGTYRKAYAIVSTDCKYVYLRIGSSVRGVTVTYSNLMIMAGDVTTTDYSPYASQTYPISLTSAGTVYGGTLDATTGELVVDRIMIPFSSFTGWGYNAPYFYAYSPTGARLKAAGDTNIISDIYKNAGAVAVASMPNGTIKGRASDNTIYVHDDRATTTSALLALIGDNQTCYTLATPLTYTLTPSQITSLLGTNHVWADCGEVAVEYVADTKMYIDNIVASL